MPGPAQEGATVSCGPNKRLKIRGLQANSTAVDDENIKPGNELNKALHHERISTDCQKKRDPLAPLACPPDSN